MLARLPDTVRTAGVALLIVDEAHFIKNPEAARSQTVKAANRDHHRTAVEAQHRGAGDRPGPSHGTGRTVQVHRLLAKDSVDERIREIQRNKALLFDAYARQSDAKEGDSRAIDAAWHRPAELDDAAVPLERRVIMDEELRLAGQPIT